MRNNYYFRREVIEVEIFEVKPNCRWVAFCCLILIITLFGTFCSAGKSGVSNEISWKATSTSRIEVAPGNESAIIENHNYLFKWHPYRVGQFGTVISQITTWKVGNWNGHLPTLRATAYRVFPDGVQKEAWSISEEADEGKLDEGFYHTIWYGCCSASANHRLYNVETGNLIMEYDGTLLEVELPAVKSRYIGYKPAETITLNPWEKEKKHIGTLTYSSSDGILHRIALKGIKDDYEDIFGLGFAGIALVANGEEHQRLVLDAPPSSREAKLFTNFKVRLRFYSGYTIEIPIIEDEFIIDPGIYKECEILPVRSAEGL